MHNLSWWDPKVSSLKDISIATILISFLRVVGVCNHPTSSRHLQPTPNLEYPRQNFPIEDQRQQAKRKRRKWFRTTCSCLTSAKIVCWLSYLLLLPHCTPPLACSIFGGWIILLPSVLAVAGRALLILVRLVFTEFIRSTLRVACVSCRHHAGVHCLKRCAGAREKTAVDIIGTRISISLCDILGYEGFWWKAASIKLLMMAAEANHYGRHASKSCLRRMLLYVMFFLSEGQLSDTPSKSYHALMYNPSSHTCIINSPKKEFCATMQLTKEAINW